MATTTYPHTTIHFIILDGNCGGYAEAVAYRARLERVLAQAICAGVNK